MRLYRFTSGLAASILYIAGCGGNGISPDADSGMGDAPDAGIEAFNEDLSGKVTESTLFQGMVLGNPSDVFWDIDDRDGTDGRDVIGMSAGELYQGTLGPGYEIPGKYTHTLHARGAETSAQSGGLALILDTHADRMGETLDEAYAGATPQTARGTPYSVWRDLVQADSRYMAMGAGTLAAVESYEDNLARPFGAKSMAQVRVALFPGDGLVVYELGNPDLYVNMGGVFEAVEVDRNDAQTLIDIIDSL
jgi:hypothetical protein